MNRKPLSKSTRGITTAIIAVIIVVIIVVASAGTYYVLTRGGSTTTGNTSHTSSTLTTSTTSSGVAATTTTTSSTSPSSVAVSSSSTALSTSSSSISQETTSCTTTFASTTATSSASTATSLPNFADLFGNFSQMTIYENATSNGQSSAINSSYIVLSTSTSGAQTIYQVNLTSTVSGSRQSGSMSYASNGTVLSATFNGATLPQFEATTIVFALMTPFILELTTNAQLTGLLGSSQMTQVNKTQITIGPTAVSVTNYKASSTPFTYSYCGLNETISSIVLQTGTVAGTSFSIITFESFQGSQQGQTESYVIQVTSITKA
ncbi:MAG: hypothetical protein ACRDF4_11230 [Rhabdochlamydiaceae bacterium]